jgi:signal transduction histidine kinase
MDGPLNEAQKTSSERIYANSRQLLSMVNSLLDQAQLERGTFKLNYSYFTPTKFAEITRQATESLATAKGLEFIAEVDESCPAKLFADFERSQQIAINLLDNAIKFTESGGVSLRIFSPDDDYWAFSVTDTGPGIAPKNQSIIFQAFRQLDDLATRKHGGVGLGLSIVQHLTLVMMGKVWVESEIGKGSTFTVLLPFNPEKEKI